MHQHCRRFRAIRTISDKTDDLEIDFQKSQGAEQVSPTSRSQWWEAWEQWTMSDAGLAVLAPIGYSYKISCIVGNFGFGANVSS